eukprot:Polyplicarium_translucidae@DN3731_c0_g1_i1.p1
MIVTQLTLGHVKEAHGRSLGWQPVPAGMCRHRIWRLQTSSAGDRCSQLASSETGTAEGRCRRTATGRRPFSFDLHCVHHVETLDRQQFLDRTTNGIQLVEGRSCRVEVTVDRCPLPRRVG